MTNDTRIRVLSLDEDGQFWKVTQGHRWWTVSFGNGAYNTAATTIMNESGRRIAHDSDLGRRLIREVLACADGVGGAA